MVVKVAGVEAGKMVELFTANPADPTENASDYFVSSFFIMPIPGTYKMPVGSTHQATVIASPM
ncbi:hypothetical protein N7519_003936 [Penicillium mononematosum]|uniref:uncharacterized protein n=1 Tax=Penicillium mononematosum TaxID=268346 RepID=UPI00254844CA|nr:uncharacterized protein N7519_003936 [Penicillium mononematosum]KAJ6189028.1 hypothetical protein N7519_003936 [Penicillium mononematosum]